MNDEKVAQGLGWFSIALGLYELLAPDHLSRTLGLGKKSGLIRFYGIREIGTGVGILSQFEGMLAPWLWGRVGGDAVDIATLGTGLASDNPKRGNAIVAMVLVVGIAVLDILCAKQLSERGR